MYSVFTHGPLRGLHFIRVGGTVDRNYSPGPLGSQWWAANVLKDESFVHDASWYRLYILTTYLQIIFVDNYK